MTGDVFIFLSFITFSETRTSPLCFRASLFKENNPTSLWNFATYCLFLLCRFPFSRFFMHSQRLLLTFPFGQDWRKKTFAFSGKWLEHSESREILCVHRSKLLTVSFGPKYKISSEWFWCLYNKVVDRQFEATNQWINDNREQLLPVDTKDVALIRVPIEH